MNVEATIGGGPWGPSYEVRSDGDTVLWTGVEGGEERRVSVAPGTDGWEAFWVAVDSAGAWTWEARYSDPAVLDGTSWSLRLEHQGRAVTASGGNAYPPGWEQLRAAVEQLAGRPWR